MLWSLRKSGRVEARQETPKKSSNFPKLLPCDDKPSLLANKIASSLKMEVGGRRKMSANKRFVLGRLARYDQSAHGPGRCHHIQNRR